MNEKIKKMGTDILFVAVITGIIIMSLTSQIPPRFSGWKPVVVEPGQTIWTIGTSILPNVYPSDVVDVIVDRNHAYGDIQPGQTLWVPTKAS